MGHEYKVQTRWKGGTPMRGDTQNSYTFQPIFHCKLGSRWVTKANEMGINNMKYTWPMREFCIADPTRPIFHLFALGVCVRGNVNFSLRIGGNANSSVFKYQHVGIPNAKLSLWEYCPMRRPNVSVFALQGNSLTTVTTPLVKLIGSTQQLIIASGKNQK